MIPVHDLFESHLNVTDLHRSMSFFGQTLGLELAEVFWERRVAFYWNGGRGNSMLGLWEVGTGPPEAEIGDQGCAAASSLGLSRENQPRWFVDHSPEKRQRHELG